jgi:hypothetical protein
MSYSSTVRFSRDGDQFHYLWAARRCLRLLQPFSKLVAVTIEGASVLESPGSAFGVAEEIIDVAEYYGSENIADSQRISYLQLKHSTKNVREPWTPSGLERTIGGFAKRFQELTKTFGLEFVADRFQFCFVSNRPVDRKFIDSIEDARNGATSRHPAEYKKLTKFTKLRGSRLSAFCKLLTFVGEQPGFLEQRIQLGYETTQYLAGNDVDAPVRLKELVVCKATSEGAADPAIRYTDVLRALNVNQHDLFPAQPHLTDGSNSIVRQQEQAMAKAIVEANAPLIIHASGGVGKSVLAQRLGRHFPAGSAVVVYDCFANGAYRRAASKRHRHKDALVQIANEFSTSALCDLLIPTPHADTVDFLRTFAHRLRQTQLSLGDSSPDALVIVIVDAADNAELVARESADGHSFIRDLLQEPLPHGVRLVALSRTERVYLLEAPSTVQQLELKAFEKNETAELLKAKFPGASEPDVEEFHRLTSRNPRVQAAVLSEAEDLSGMLRQLGPQPTTVEDMLAGLLEKAVNKLLDNAPAVERSQIQRICTALAVLRPFIPISIIAELTNVDPAAIRSFAADLGRPLLIAAEAIQFRDEPTETWFRKRFKPATPQELQAFIDVLRPLANTNAYAAAALPQLMLEAGELTQLVELALSSHRVGESRPVEQRDVEVQRLLFALKASLKAQRYEDAAKLAMKAAQETVGHERQFKLFQDNPDLVARFIKPEQLLEMVSRRPFHGKWLGAEHEYEAAMLSYIPDFLGDARSRLRMAYDWLRAWFRLPDERRRQEQFDATDLANLAMVELHISGPARCANFIRSWRPRELGYRAGAIVARICVDHARYSELNEIARAAGNNLYFVLAINCELRRVQRHVPDECIRRSLRLLQNCGTVKPENTPYDSEPMLAGIVALIESALFYQIEAPEKLGQILEKFLPERPAYSIVHHYGRERITWLKAFALRSALAGTELTLTDVAPAGLAKELKEARAHSESSELREFKETMSALIPWHRLRANRLVVSQQSASATISDAIAVTRQESARGGGYSWSSERSRTQDEIAEIWFDILARENANSETELESFESWLANLQFPLFTPTSTRLARIAARVDAFHAQAHGFARGAFDVMVRAREDAESKSEVYVGLSRALIPLDATESEAYFNEAVRVASRMGDEALERWSAILDLADNAADDTDLPEYAYRVARSAEVVEAFNSKHFEWQGTLHAICGLSPRSGFAVLSRWRDRSFGSFAWLLPIVSHELMEHNHIESEAVAALVGFEAEWKYREVLTAALSRTPKARTRQTFETIFRYFRLHSSSAADLKAFARFARDNNIAEPGLDDALVEDLQHHTPPGIINQERELSTANLSSSVPNLDDVFDGLEIHTDQGLSEAHRRFQEIPPPREGFTAELVRRVAVGREVELIQTYVRSALFDLYDHRKFLEQLPDGWKSRLSVQAALKEAVKELCSKFCMEITRSRYYQTLPFTQVAKVAGLSEQELTNVVLDSISQATEEMDSSRLFTLIGLLAPQLLPNQALSALDFGLALIEQVVEEADADGPWGPHISPPVNCRQSLAGLVYAALGSPKAALRWQAAHVIKNLCWLDQHDVVAGVIQLAQGGNYLPFTDARLKFYELTARQWLLIALSRVAHENGAKAVCHLPFLLKHALGEDHVAIRHFAASAALAIAKHNLGEINAETLTQLTNVNRSPFPLVVSERYRRYERQSKGESKKEKAKRFHFSFDFDRYWFEPLASCFAKDQSEVAEIAESVVFEDWKVEDEGGWQSDERAKRRLYDEREHWHSHSSYPRSDDLSFYFSYHSMMIAAGKLLASSPVHQDPQDSQDEFQEWLQRHVLTRYDGRWLADRRDPPPDHRKRSNERIPDEQWRWSLQREDFDRAIGTGEQWLSLWGHWTTASGRQEESVNITSALVSPDRADALLRAAQTTGDAHRFPIPSAESDHEIQHPQFQLTGWIVDNNLDSRLDEYDLWAGRIHFPGPQPAPAISMLLNLNTDPDKRLHVSSGSDKETVHFLSTVWGDQSEDGYDRERESGSSARVSPSFLTELLVQTKMELVVKVIMERRIRLSRYERPSGDYDGYLPPYSRIYIVRSDGQFRTM